MRKPTISVRLLQIGGAGVISDPENDIGGPAVVNRRWRLLAPLVVLVVVALVPAVASAAPPTPVSTTACGGPLTIDPSPTTDDPYLVDYKFHCSEDITAYSVIVTRRVSDFDGTVDDFDSNPQVFDPAGAPSATTAVSCSGVIPGNGINCNAGAGGVVSAWNNVQGSFDLVEPYCKYLPSGAKPGTLAAPQAVVNLIVTNTTGAQNGPVRLALSAACRKVADYVPFRKATKPKPKKTKPKQSKKTKKSTRNALRHS